MRRTDFQKATTYTGQKIKNAVVSYKIDGMRVLYRDGQIVTRNNKVPPGLATALTKAAIWKIKEYKDCEIYMGDFLTTNGTLAQHNPENDCITADMVYPLVELDARLILYTAEFINHEALIEELNDAVDKGYEGLVVRCLDKDAWYRVKPTSTATVKVTGWFEQLDKNKNPKGVLGGFDTDWGKVTAFDDETRKKLWNNPEQYTGEYIEVTYKERYHTGKFRYAVKFVDFRIDVSQESFDTEPPTKGE